MANKYLDLAGLQDYTTKLNTKLKTIFATKGEVGAPLVASTVAEMTDEDRIYVYTGSETGYTSGNWYYWDGEAWTSGGTYNSQGIGDGEVTTEKIANGAVTEQKLSGELASVIRDLGDDLYNLYPNDIAEGEIASFPDGADDIPVKSMTVNVEPYQNLNGYDYPWVGGAGKNKVDDAEFRKYSNWSDSEFSGDYASDLSNRTFKLPTTNGVQYTLSFGITSSTFPTYLSLCSASGSASQLVIRYTTDIVQRTYYTFTATNDTYYLRLGSLTSESSFNGQMGKISYIQLEESASATSYAPYSNICPIYPANGQNLFNGEFIDGNNYIDATSGSMVNTTSTPEYRCTDYIDCSAWQGQNITLNHGPRGSSTGIAFYDSSKVYISGIANQSATAGTPRIYLVPSTAYYLRFTTIVDYVDDCQLELGNTATPYVPYRAFGSTRCGFNVWDEEWEKGEYNSSGAKASNNNRIRSTNFIHVIPNETYYFMNSNANDKWLNICEYDEDMNFIALVSKRNTTYTIPSNVHYLTIFCNSDYGTTYANDICINISCDKNGTYEPYTGERYYSRDYNMWDEEIRYGYYDSSTGAFVANDSTLANKNPIMVKPSTNYYLGSGTYNLYVSYYDSNGGFISQSTATKNVVLTTPSNCYQINFSNPFGGGTTYNNDIIINYSDPSQVGYGGVLDVETGLLTVTKNLAVFNGVGYSFSYTDETNNGRISWGEYQSIGKVGGKAFLSDKLKMADAYTSEPNVWEVSNSGASVARCFIGVPDTITSVDGWRAYCETNPIQLVYELATPVKYQLTPTQVRTLLGYNNIWTDSGTVEVNYRADTTKYIQKLIGSTEDDMIANANIPAHQYFMVGMELFYSTSAIAQGSAIVVGTNCTRTTLAEALNAINS